MKKLAFIKRSSGSHWVGDGFPVRSIFSYSDLATELSPFLLLDYAGPAEFPPTGRKLGVGQHPHRGFETVTLVYAGAVSHRDSSGGGGTIGPGEVQWMTAGAGIIHEEYHSREYAALGGPFEMIQLWVNLPARHKLTAPGYQGISAAQIPTLDLPDGAGQARIIAGQLGEVQGPARTFSPVNLWELQLKAGRRLSLELPEGYTSALFVRRGAIRLGDSPPIRAAELGLLERAGRQLVLDVLEDTDLLLLNGAPLNEPIVGHGPFVMNSRAEILQAIQDFNSGHFGQIGQASPA